MYKNRNFLIGLGIGFILCGILLIISNGDFNSFFSTSDNSTSNELTIEELKEIANEKNLYLYTEEELNELINSLEKTDDKVTETKDETSNNDEDAKTETGVETNKNIFKFSIPYGLDSFEVADYLFSVGVLKDKQMFQEILTKNDLTKKIISDGYETGDLSIEELIELITNTNIKN